MWDKVTGKLHVAATSQSACSRPQSADVTTHRSPSYPPRPICLWLCCRFLAACVSGLIKIIAMGLSNTYVACHKVNDTLVWKNVCQNGIIVYTNYSMILKPGTKQLFSVPYSLAQNTDTYWFKILVNIILYS